MRKLSFLLFVVFVLSCPVSGKVVFNIDIQPDDANNGWAYEGDQNAVYDDGVNNWYTQLVFTETGWPIPYNFNFGIWPSAGKPEGANHGLRIMVGWFPGPLPGYFNTDPTFNSLMADGATDPSGSWGPKLQFFGDVASVGVYDIYVYSNTKTEFRWEHWAADPCLYDWRTLTGYQGVWDENEPNFVEGENYLVYEDLSIDAADHDDQGSYEWAMLHFRTPFDPCGLGSLSAIQLVYEGLPIEINEPNGTTINPTAFTFAHDLDSYRGPYRGPDKGPYPRPVLHQISWCQQGEWLDYHIFAIDDANEGYYDVNVALESSFPDANCGVSLDGGPVHEVSAYGAYVNQFAGTWKISTEGNVLRLDVLTESPFIIHGINFQWAADQNDYCPDVQERLETLDMDFNGDCIVNMGDFAEFAAEWRNCNDPAGCP